MPRYKIMSEQDGIKRGSKQPENSNWGGDMLERTGVKPEKISLIEIISQLTKSQREKLIAGYDLRNFARIFEDSDTMAMVDGFLENDMNISETAKKLYMHRNTLIYRLNKIYVETGLDLRKFDMALTFDILRILYTMR